MDRRARKLDFVPPQLAAAMSHPTRVRAMTVLIEGTASPRQIAEQIGEPLNNVSYHLKQLERLGCIEPVRTERVHGGRVVEHFFRAVHRVYFDDDAWAMLDEKEQLGLNTAAMRIISEDIEEAMATGTFFGSHNSHISRSPMILDEEGWQEVSDLLTETTERLIQISDRVDERNDGEAEASIHTKVELLQFRSPSPRKRRA